MACRLFFFANLLRVGAVQVDDQGVSKQSTRVIRDSGIANVQIEVHSNGVSKHMDQKIAVRGRGIAEGREAPQEEIAQGSAAAAELVRGTIVMKVPDATAIKGHSGAKTSIKETISDVCKVDRKVVSIKFDDATMLSEGQTTLDTLTASFTIAPPTGTTAESVKAKIHAATMTQLGNEIQTKLQRHHIPITGLHVTSFTAEAHKPGAVSVESGSERAGRFVISLLLAMAMVLGFEA